MKFLSQLFLVLLSLGLNAQGPLESEYHFNHSDCNVRLKDYSTNQKEDLDREEMKALGEIVKDKLEERNFTIKPFIDNKRILENEMYLTWERSFQGGIYKRCEMTVQLRQAKGQYPRDNDPILYQKTIERRVPRITFRGMERCKLALQETFIHIPHCRAIGYYGEKK